MGENTFLLVREDGGHELFLMYRKHGAVYVLVLSGLFLCCLVSGHPISGVLSLVCFAVLLIALFIDAPQLAVKYLPFIFAVVANVVGCAVCEYSTVYLDELGVDAGFRGSLPLLVLSRSVFLVAAAFMDLRFGMDNAILKGKTSVSDSSVKWINLLALVCAIYYVILFAQVADNPSFLQGMSRFVYRTSFLSSGLLTSIAPYAFIFSLMALRYGNKLFGGVGFAFRFLFLLWTGNKFSAFFALACVVLIVFYDKWLALGVERIRQIVGLVCVMMFVMVASALLLFSFTGKEDPLDYFSHRAPEQGQMWWATYAATGGEPHVGELSDEVDGALNGDKDIKGNVGSNYGIYKNMYLVAPASQVNAHLKAGARYTESGYAIAYYYFGAVGPVVFSLVMSLVVVLVVNLLLWSVTCSHLVCAILLLRLYGRVKIMLVMALFTGVFDAVSLVSYAVLILSLLMVCCGAASRKCSPRESSTIRFGEAFGLRRGGVSYSPRRSFAKRGRSFLVP